MTRTNKKSNPELLTAIVIVCLLMGSLFAYLLIDSRTNNNLVSPTKNNVFRAVFGLPVRLKIEAININAPVEQVGLTADGSMDTPKNPMNVAWYSAGKRPGEIGSAVIAGHYGRWENGQGSVFDNLSKLQKGDRLTIEDSNGAASTFVVRESRSYNPQADASGIFDSKDGKSHLNLITCEGGWNKASESYSSRLVIFADKE